MTALLGECRKSSRRRNRRTNARGMGGRRPVNEPWRGVSGSGDREMCMCYVSARRDLYYRGSIHVRVNNVEREI